MQAIVTPNDRVRLLLRASNGSTHSLEVVVLAADPAFLRVRVEASGREATIPRSSVITIEKRSNGKMVAAAFPSDLCGVAAQVEAVLIEKRPQDHLSVEAVTAAIGRLQAIAASLADPVAIKVLHQVQEGLRSLARLHVSADFTSADRAAKDVREALARVEAEIPRFASTRSFANSLRDLSQRVRADFESCWAAYEERFLPKPRFLAPPEPLLVTVGATSEAVLPLRVQLSGASAAAHDVEVVLQAAGPHMRQIGASPRISELAPGAVVSVRLDVSVADEAPEGTTAEVQVFLRYRPKDGGLQKSTPQKLLYRLEKARPFVPIRPNPFGPYADGTTVADSQMFFGREELLEEISERLVQGPNGQCFALYGQKRSGKSSFLRQIQKRLQSEKLLVFDLSFGTIDRDNLTTSFVRNVLDEVRPLLDAQLTPADSSRLMSLWPSEDRIERKPLECLRSSLKAGMLVLRRYPGWENFRYVLLADEFTYLYEVLRRADVDPAEVAAVREFMRQWKALHDGQYLSSLVVGQDTMPYFIEAFQNEFSMMSVRRLSYLTVQETAALASQPIPLPNGNDRYRHFAKEVVHQYTAGHPYFTQILCDRLVRRANMFQRSEFTDGDVAEAVESLVTGPDCLDPHRFDCFLSADNTGLLVARSDAASTQGESEDRNVFNLLYKIANMAGAQNRPVAYDDLQPGDYQSALLDDLLVREVLIQNDQRDAVQIKVLLFADYMRGL